MNRIKQQINKQLSEEDITFANEIKNILQLTNVEIKMLGSYKRFGKNYACDLDFNQNLNDFNRDTFLSTLNNYINKLYQNKNNFTFITSYFDMKHKILDDLYNLLPPINGLYELDAINEIDEILNKKINEINKIINLLPIKLKNRIYLRYNNYLQNKSLINYALLLSFVKEKIKPIWSLNKLRSGVLEYYGETFKISDYDYTYFYVEIFYKNFKASNYLYIKKDIGDNNTFFNVDVTTLIKNNQISYIIAIKNYINFLKWFIYSKKITRYDKINKIVNLHNRVFDFRYNVSNIYNKICKIDNKYDILKIKIKKYKKKLKLKNNIIYKNKIQKYINKQKEYQDKTNKIFIELNDNCKTNYEEFTKKYTYFIKRFMLIK